jgi:hypothetical protein
MPTGGRQKSTQITEKRQQSFRNFAFFKLNYSDPTTSESIPDQNNTNSSQKSVFFIIFINILTFSIQLFERQLSLNGDLYFVKFRFLFVDRKVADTFERAI